MRIVAASVGVVLAIASVPVGASGASAAEATAEPSIEPSIEPGVEASIESTATPTNPGEAPFVVDRGSVSLKVTATSASYLRVVGTAEFTSTGDLALLPDGGLVATIVFASDGGARHTVTAEPVLVSDEHGAQTWTVALERTLATSGRVSVTLGGTVASARYDKRITRTSGWAASGHLSRTAGDTWSRSITVSPAQGRKVRLETLRDGRWVTVATARTRDVARDTVTFTFKGADTRWYATGRGKYRYRVVVPATAALQAAGSREVIVRPRMAYRAASGFTQPVLAIAPRPGGYSVGPGRNGNKVKAIQRAVGLGSRWETMDATTVDAVRRFQRRHGLSATGVVDKRTWLAMGLSSAAWYDLGGYTHPVVADRSATRAERIEIMIATARTYIGSEYVWGGSGRPKDGADCSGLVMQAMYAAGMPTSGTDVVRHTDPGFRTTRALFGANYQHVALSRAKRGDLIFFTSNGGTPAGIIHMGIYLGGGQMIDMSTTSNTTQVRSIHALDRYTDIVPEVVRVFS
ncbi:NlpC/P60 family protein [Demequina maris]|uniref:NlpC/P60 family protein n=1 Tax=Demequina maris TaxID=1638982 RepID=UPI0007836269|nr:C40 family peptidase [Demequina maris]